MEKVWLILFALGIININAQVLDVGEYIYFTNVKDDLLLYVTKEGLCTYDGIINNKFDETIKGKKLEYIQSKPYGDGRGHIWFTLYDRLCHLDLNTHEVEDRTLINGDTILSRYTIIDKFDSEQELLLSSGGQITHYNMATGKYDFFKGKSDAVFYSNVECNQFIGYFWKGGKGIEFLRIEQDSIIVQYHGEDLFNYHISDALFLNNHFFLASDKGLIQGEIENDEISDASIIFDQYSVNNLTISDGRLFFTTNGGGIFQYLTNSNSKPELVTNEIKNPFRIQVKDDFIFFTKENEIHWLDIRAKPMVSTLSAEKFTSSSMINHKFRNTSLAFNQNTIEYLDYANKSIKLRTPTFFLQKNQSSYKDTLFFGYEKYLLKIYPNEENLIFEKDSTAPLQFHYKRFSATKSSYAKSSAQYCININGTEKCKNFGYIYNTKKIGNTVYVLTQNGIWVDKAENDLVNKVNLFVPIDQPYDIEYYQGLYFIYTPEHVFVYNDKTNSFQGRIGLGKDMNERNYSLKKVNDSLVLQNPQYFIDLSDYVKYLRNEKASINISEIFINNVTRLFDENLNAVQRIVLNPNEYALSIKTNLKSLFSQDLGFIKYRIPQFHNEWRTIKSNQILEYVFDEPGKYNFELIGVSRELIESEIKRIVIIKKQPLLQNPWFLAFISLVLISIGGLISYLISHQKLRAKQRELDRQKELELQRRAIADDLHDELGTELNKILYLSDEVNYSKTEEEKKSIIDRIGLLAGKSIKNMRDMLWVLDDSNKSLASLISRLRISISGQLKDYNIKADFDMPTDVPEINLSNLIRKNILLIFKESINNVIKHAESDHVTFSVRHDGQQLTLILKDVGKGYRTNQAFPGYGLKSIQTRADTIGADLLIDSVFGQGTSIELIYPLATVN